MKELNKKVFLILFGMLTVILIVSLVIVNIIGYRREYESISRNLRVMDDRGMFGGAAPPDSEGDMNFQNGNQEPKKGEFSEEASEEASKESDEAPDIENMMFMDHEVYTAELTNGVVTRIISHGNVESDFNAETAANEILTEYSNNTIRIKNLYRDGYSFNYRWDKIVIINQSSIASKLRKLLIETIIIFIVLEAIIAVVAKLVTSWITKPAREAFDKQREFIADASHELKTPLAVIMASSDEITEDESNKKYIENIRYESDRMNKLISGLLDLSKLEEGVSQAEYKDENLSKIVEKTSLVFEGVAYESGVAMESDIEEGITLKCSKDEMEKLTSTLIDNAIKHSYKDTAVAVKLYRSKNNVVLKVINHGDPIAEGDEEKIFERFYRADKSRTRSENRYGLGLAIAKKIVTNHGGTIKAFSGEAGTEFRVVL